MCERTAIAPTAHATDLRFEAVKAHKLFPNAVIVTLWAQGRVLVQPWSKFGEKPVDIQFFPAPQPVVKENMQGEFSKS